MQHTNNTACANLHIPVINVKLLRRLSDLDKYGVESVSMSTLPDASITEIIDNMAECLSHTDRVGFIKLARQVVTEKQHLFNVHVHRNLVHFFSPLNFNNRFGNQYKQACINYQNLLIKLINLHINECDLYKKQHNHKKIRYMLRKQKQMQSSECVWCIRGCELIN